MSTAIATPAGCRNIPVYRKYQLTMTAPCQLGDPCPACAPHIRCLNGDRCFHCRNGKPYTCERAQPTEPAFFVTFRYALAMIYEGLARFVHRNTALQLTFGRVENLRDQSCHVNEMVILDYLLGRRSTRIAVALGWNTPALVTEKTCPAFAMFPFV